MHELPFQLLHSRQYVEVEVLLSDSSYLEAVCSNCETRKREDGYDDSLGIFDLLANLQLVSHHLGKSQHKRVRASATQLRRMFNVLVERSQLIRRFPGTVSQEIANYCGHPFAERSSPTKPVPTNVSGQLLISERVLTNKSVIGHSSAITALEVSPCGQYFLSGSADGHVGYWRLDQDQPLWLVGAHRGTVNQVTFSPDGRRALSSGEEGAVLLWELDLAIGHQLYDHYLSPDKSRQWTPVWFCKFLDNDYAIIFRTGHLKLINVTTGHEKRENRKIGFYISDNQRTSFDFAQKARLLVIGDTNRTLTFLKGQTLEVITTYRTTAIIRRVAVSPAAQSLVVEDDRGRLTVYKLQYDQTANTIMINVIDTLDFKKLYAVVHSFEESVFFIWDMTGEFYKLIVNSKVEIEPRTFDQLGDLVTISVPRIASSPDSARLIIAESSLGIRLMSWKQKRVLHQWEAGSALLMGALFPGRQGAIGLRGTRFAGEPKKGQQVVFIDHKGRQKVVAQAPHGHFTSGAATVGPKLAVTVDKGGTAVIWECGKVRQVHTSNRFDFTACAGWNEARLGVCVTQEAEIITLGKGGAIQQDELLANTYTQRTGIAAIAIVGKPRKLFAVYFSGEVRFSGADHSWRGRGPIMMATAVALDQGCHFAASGNINGEVVLWRCADGSIAHAFSAHQGEITALAFSADGRELYTAGVDRCIYKIDISVGQIVQGTILPLPPIALLTEPDGLLSVLDAQGNIYRIVTRGSLQAYSSTRAGTIVAVLVRLLSLLVTRLVNRRRKEHHHV